MANVKNLASGVLVNNVTSSETVLSVNTGTASSANLVAVWPSVPFFVTVMPYLPAIGVANSLDSEIMEVTAISSDGANVVMTVERGKKGTTAKSFNAGAVVTNGIYDDYFLDKFYPVGTVYVSTSLTTASAVGAQFGGTWSSDGSSGGKYTFIRTA